MLTLDGLSLTSGDFTLTADLSIAPGQIVAVIGPSGAGKSTLLNAIAGFLTPVQGRILWGGVDLTALPPGERPLAMLFQDGNLFPHLTVAQNVGLGINPRLRLSRDDHARIIAALDRVELSGLGDRRPGTLSGGQQSRAALARILVQRRPLMLLDEPFAALGPALKADMLTLVRDLAQASGATVLMVSHDPEYARRIADQTIVVADGRASNPKDTFQILDNPPPALQEYLRASPKGP